MDLTVVSFNIRLATLNDGPHYWPLRRQVFFDVTRKLSPDLLGLQEVTSPQLDDLTAAFPDYDVVSTGRDDGQRNGEACSIFFRKSRFGLRDSGTFWLSETPEVIASKSWDAGLTRICTWAKLQDRAAGREILFLNAHLDYAGDMARTHSGALIARRVAAMRQGEAVILTGDFNTNEGSQTYQALTHPTEPAAIALIDAYRTVHPIRRADEASFNGFQGTVDGSRIDWILHSPDLIARNAMIDRSKGENGLFPSDHCAVTATLHYADRR